MSDIFNSQDRLYGDIPILRANREPCLVCGHPTGDCTPEDHNPQNIHIALAATESRTLGERLIYVDEDIWGERQISSFTTARVLLAKKGQHVTLEKAKELGIKIN